MTIEACIAHAIHKDLDIIAAVPTIYELPVEKLEPYIENYIETLQRTMVRAVTKLGEPFLKSDDAAGLCVTCLRAGVDLPAEMMLKMCQTIVNLNHIDARFIADNGAGVSLYYMKLKIGG